MPFIHDVALAGAKPARCFRPRYVHMCICKQRPLSITDSKHMAICSGISIRTLDYCC